jgi:hypothetical protein
LLVWWCGVILGAAIGHTVDGWSLREAIMKKQIMLGIIVGVAVIATHPFRSMHPAKTRQS